MKKLMVVLEVLKGRGTMQEITQKYKFHVG